MNSFLGSIKIREFFFCEICKIARKPKTPLYSTVNKKSTNTAMKMKERGITSFTKNICFFFFITEPNDGNIQIFHYYFVEFNLDKKHQKL